MTDSEIEQLIAVQRAGSRMDLIMSRNRHEAREPVLGTPERRTASSVRPKQAGQRLPPTQITKNDLDGTFITRRGGGVLRLQKSLGCLRAASFTTGGKRSCPIAPGDRCLFFMCGTPVSAAWRMSLG